MIPAQVIDDKRLNKLAPSDRWYYIVFIARPDQIQERGPLAALGLSPEEYSRWLDRLTAAGLYPRSFT